MKIKKNYFICLVIITAMIMISISTTLALVNDEKETESGILKFDNVSILGDVAEGSKLSVSPINEIYNDGEVVFDSNFNGEQLYFKATETTVDFYARVQVYYTINDVIDNETQTLLDSLNDRTLPLNGLKMYADENYGYTFMDGWYYLVTDEGGELLKVGSAENQFIISQYCKLDLSHLEENVKEQIFDLFSENDIILKVVVEAVQAYGVSDIESDNNAFDSESAEDIIFSENSSSKEDIYGNTKIIQFKQAILDNLGFQAITLSFDKNNEDVVGSIKNKTIFFGDIVNLPTDELTLPAYVLAGWSFSPNGEIITHTDYLGFKNSLGNKNSATLYAIWRPLFESGLPKTVQSSLSGWTWSEIKFASDMIAKANKKRLDDNLGTWKANPKIEFEDGSSVKAISFLTAYSTYKDVTRPNDVKAFEIYDPTSKLTHTLEIRINNDSTQYKSTKSFTLPNYTNTSGTKSGTTTMQFILADFLHDDDKNGNKIGMTFVAKNLYGNITTYYGAPNGAFNTKKYIDEFFTKYLEPNFDSVDTEEDIYNDIVAVSKSYRNNKKIWLLSSLEVGQFTGSHGYYYPIFITEQPSSYTPKDLTNIEIYRKKTLANGTACGWWLTMTNSVNPNDHEEQWVEAIGYNGRRLTSEVNGNSYVTVGPQSQKLGICFAFAM